MKKIIFILIMMLPISVFANINEQCKKAEEMMEYDSILIKKIISNTISKDADLSKIDDYPVEFLKDYYSVILLQSLEKDISEPVLLAHALTIKVSAFYQHSYNYAKEKTDDNKVKLNTVREEMAAIGKRFTAICPKAKKQ